MDLPYSLLCLAHGSHKVHNRKYCEEWLGLGQRPGGTLVYYQEGSVWRLQCALWEYAYTPGTVLIEPTSPLEIRYPHQSEDQTCHPEFLHQSRLGFPGQAAFPFFETLETVGEEPS